MTRKSRRKQGLEYDGITYKSVRELAEKYGIVPATLQSRIAKGMPLKEALTKKIPTKNMVVRDVTYQTAKELGDLNGLDSRTIRQRQKQGYTLEEALDGGSSLYKVKAFGKEHKTLRDLSTYYGIPYTVVVRKLTNEKDLETIITQIMNTEPLTFDGVEYRRFVDICLDYKIEPLLASGRIRSGWSLSDAILKPIKGVKTENTYTYRGKTYTRQRELVESQGLVLQPVLRLSRRTGLDILEALDLLVTFLERYKGNRPTSISRVPYMIYNGEWVDTYQEVCEKVNVDRRQVRHCMDKYNISDKLEALVKLPTIYKTVWVDTQTGKATDTKSLVAKYNRALETLEKRGIARKESHKVYPDCTINLEGYCATPFEDFEKYLKERFPQLAKK